MRIISIRQPWSWLICAGFKTIENRSWTTTYRGPLLIHAGQSWAHEPIESIERRLKLAIPRDLPHGGIVGIALLVNVIRISDDPFFVGPYGFVMDGARELPFIPHRGNLGLTKAPAPLIEHLYRVAQLYGTNAKE